MESIKVLFYTARGDIKKGVLAGLYQDKPVWANITEGGDIELYPSLLKSNYGLRCLCHEGQEVNSVVMMNWLGCVLNNCVDGDSEILSDYLAMAKRMGAQWSHDPIALKFDIVESVIAGHRFFIITIDEDAYTGYNYVDVDDSRTFEEAMRLVKMYLNALVSEVGIPVTHTTLGIDKKLLDKMSEEDKKLFDHIEVSV